MKRSKIRRRNNFNLGFERLENRQVLTAVFLGTNGIDSASIDYAGENLVNIQINDVLHENVDSSDGIRLNLGKSFGAAINGDRTDLVKIDHRISDPIEIYNADEILVDGGDNVFQISSLAPEVVSDPSGGPVLVDMSRFNVGTINGHITFANARILRAGAGDDTFNVEAFGTSGDFHGGDCNDLYRFAGETDSATGQSYFSGIQAFGEAGNDRFIHLPGNKNPVETFGGAGDDVVDFRYSKQAASVYFQRASDGNTTSPALEIEKFIGAKGYDNRIRLRSKTVGEQFNWIIDGNSTTIRGEATNEFVQVENFNQFHAGSNATDVFFVHSTSDDIEITDGDQIWISSEMDPVSGNLDGIDHDISIVRLGDFIQPQPPGFFSYAANLQRDVDGTTASPNIVISDMAGYGVIATFGSDNEIRGITGGVIRFVDNQRSIETIVFEAEELTPFQPNLTVHGSAIEKDIFLFEETFTPTKVLSHGGDDTFMVGSTNRAANGDLGKMAGEISIGAGTGTDRVYVNNQNFDSGTPEYYLDGSLLRFSRFWEIDSYANINLNSAVEFVRVNGSISQPNRFTIAATRSTTFVVSGATQSDITDEVGVRFATQAETPSRVNYSDNDPKRGSFGSKIAPQEGRVYFSEIESATILLDLETILGEEDIA